MLLHEIISEAPLGPLPSIMDLADETVASLPDEIRSAQEIVDILNDKMNGDVRFVIDDSDGIRMPYVRSAGFDHGDIEIGLNSSHLEQKWNKEMFGKMLKYFLGHESIHAHQMKKAGKDTWRYKYTSGWDKAMDYIKKYPEDREGANRLYLADPQEVNAHAHDLANEIDMYGLDANDVFKNYSKYADKLPTLQKYFPQGFEAHDKVIKRLMKLAWGHYNETS